MEYKIWKAGIYINKQLYFYNNVTKESQWTYPSYLQDSIDWKILKYTNTQWLKCMDPSNNMSYFNVYSRILQYKSPYLKN
jgi:hypothetical protein